MPLSAIQTQFSCADDFDPNSLPVPEALSRIDQLIEPIRARERVGVRAALDRVLAEPIVSPIDVPAHPNSAMDGYAVSSTDLPTGEDTKRLRLVGRTLAGRPFSGRIGPGDAVRIMTGAVMPDGTDTVIMQEHAIVDGETVTIGADHKPGQNRREAGEDIRAGETVLPAGKLLRPADLGLIASLGLAEVSVTRKLRVAFFSTGDELRSLGQPLEPGQIYDSNRYTLYGMLARFGAAIEPIDLGVVIDERDALREALSSAADSADAVITSGGVSVGEADFVKDILDSIGQVNFWKIAMKPGRPLAFGRIGNANFFGLPGNPVSVMVTFYQFVQPALARMIGQLEPPHVLVPAISATRLKKRPGRMEFQRGVLERQDDGSLVVHGTGDQGSGILSTMSKANCFIVLAEDNAGVEVGDTVHVQPFDGLL